MRLLARHPRSRRAAIGVLVLLIALVGLPGAAGAAGARPAEAAGPEPTTAAIAPLLDAAESAGVALPTDTAAADDEDPDGPWIYRNPANEVWLQPVSPEPGSTIGGGSVTVSVRVESPVGATATVLLSSPVGRDVPMSYDAATGRHQATVSTLAQRDRQRMTFDLAVSFPDGKRAWMSFAAVVRNEPRLAVEEPTPEAANYVAQGVEHVSVKATDFQSHPGALRVTMATEQFPDLPLIYNVVTDRFEGTWDTRALTSSTNLAQTFTVTDADGLTATSEHHVYVDNGPGIQITRIQPAAGWGGFAPVDFYVSNTQGGLTGIDVAWYVDGKLVRRGLGDADWLGGESGNRSGAIEVHGLTDGDHVLRLQVTDRANGNTASDDEPFAVRNPTNFGLDILSPLANSSISVGKIDVVTYRPRKVAGKNGPMVGYYQIDQRGEWKPLQLGADGHLTAAWNPPNRAKTGVDSHYLQVIAGDGVNLGVTGTWVNAAVAKPLRVYLPPQTVEGVASFGGSISGGALVYDPTTPITAWYRMDAGPWTLLDTTGNRFSAWWDTRYGAAGGHVFEVIATDWKGGTAYGKVIDIVRTRIWCSAMYYDYGEQPGDPVTVLFTGLSVDDSIFSIDEDSDRTVLKGYARLLDDNFVESIGGPFLYGAELDVGDRPNGSQLLVQIVITTPNGDDLAVCTDLTTLRRGGTTDQPAPATSMTAS